MLHPLAVNVANGRQLLCHTEFVDMSWSVQSYTFTSTFRVLTIQHYDVIVGMDWLEQFSPMQVHWAKKWLLLPYNNSLIRIQGELPVGCELSSVEVCLISSVSAESESTPREIPQPVQILLNKYHTVFAEPKGLPPSRACDHSIPLTQGAQPFVIRPYRYSPALKTEIDIQVQKMLKEGIIRPSSSPFSSSVVMAKKKDGSWHFCVDYRFLNALTIKGKFPLPIIDEFLDELHGASWFTKLDLRSGFHQILLKAGEEYKIAFSTHFDQYEFLVMPFGVTGGPGTFQFAMNATLRPLLRKCALVFLDDILIYSATLEEHLEHIEAVLQLLDQDGRKVKSSKCSFAQRTIAYLGHVISEAGVATDPSKISAIQAWPTPTSVKDLRSFLGLSGYYRKFVQHYGIISKPLTNLLRKYVPFVWTAEADQSFLALKQALITAPVLALPDFTKPFTIETDACGVGIGAILSQQGHPLAYVSKALGPKNMGLSTYEKEYMAIILAVEQWRSYLQHSEFTIFTDQKSLAQLNTQRLHTAWQHKVFTKLLGFQYKVLYKKGTENGAADALSRHPNHAEVMAISTVIPQWLLSVTESYATNPQAQELLQKLALAPDSVGHFTLQQGVIRYKNRIWLGSNASLQTQVFQALHESAIAGHSGFPVTYARIHQLFFWPNMKAVIKEWVQSCQTCNQAKPDRQKYPGLLQPLPIPAHAWQTVTMTS